MRRLLRLVDWPHSKELNDICRLTKMACPKVQLMSYVTTVPAELSGTIALPQSKSMFADLYNGIDHLGYSSEREEHLPFSFLKFRHRGKIVVKAKPHVKLLYMWFWQLRNMYWYRMKVPPESRSACHPRKCGWARLSGAQADGTQDGCPK